MARSQFTFTFPNAQPGAAVTFSAAVYSSKVDADADGPTLVLDSTRTVAVWTDATELTATWKDGAGASITAEASLDRPVVTAIGGVPGESAASSAAADPYLYIAASPGNHSSFGIDYMLPLVQDASNGNTPVGLATSDLLTAPAGGNIITARVAAHEFTSLSLAAIRFADTTDITLDTVSLVVWKVDGSQVLQLDGGFSTVHITKANPLYIVDFRDLSPYLSASVGSDITVDSGTGAIVTAAGGAFMCSAYVAPIIVTL